MPIQEYECKQHGRFEVALRFSDDVPVELSCPRPKKNTKSSCGRMAKHVLSPPAAIVVEGGTGAGRGRRAG